jgi:hypothetical protein
LAENRGSNMHLGVFYFPVDYGIDISELARALEDRGYESATCGCREAARGFVGRRSQFGMLLFS